MIASARMRRFLVFVTLSAVLLILLAACSGPESISSTEVAEQETEEATDPQVEVESTPSTNSESPATATTSPVTETPQTEGEPTVTTPADQPPATANQGAETPTESSDETVAPTNTPAPVPVEPGSFDPAAVDPDFEQAGTGFEQPVFVTHAGDGSGTVYVLEKVGTLKRLDGTMVLDIRNQVVQTGVFGYEHEQGMLGVAFHPQFADNGYFYMHYNDVDGDHVISRFTMNSNGIADPASELVLLEFDQPEVNFQGGMLLFGEDGYLYIGTGTGGAEVDLQFLAQDLDSLYGKILRIDVDGGDPYSIPEDNPFVSVDGALPEIWAYGLRNPWRFSFDRATGDLYIGGPGQFTEEWINYLPGTEQPGVNFAWPMYEGTQCWDEWVGPCDPEGMRLPILTYPTYENGNCVVIGGYVHRAASTPLLNGAYFFGDFCSGNVWTGWQSESGQWQSEQVFSIPGLISSFGEDEAGELYICDINNGVVYRITASAS